MAVFLLLFWKLYKKRALVFHLDLNSPLAARSWLPGHQKIGGGGSTVTMMEPLVAYEGVSCFQQLLG